MSTQVQIPDPAVKFVQMIKAQRWGNTGQREHFKLGTQHQHKECIMLYYVVGPCFILKSLQPQLSPLRRGLKPTFTWCGCLQCTRKSKKSKQVRCECSLERKQQSHWCSWKRLSSHKNNPYQLIMTHSYGLLLHAHVRCSSDKALLWQW